MRPLLLFSLLFYGCALSHEVGDDAGARPPDAGGCSGSFFCFTSCDTGALGVCVDGAWHCPAGSSATPPSECCSPTEPPPRPGCVCGFVWMCPEEADAGTSSFACGDSLVCTRGTHYCEISRSDVGGEPDQFHCRSYPESCTTPSSCECFPPVAGRVCADDGSGGVTVTFLGG